MFIPSCSLLNILQLSNQHPNQYNTNPLFQLILFYIIITNSFFLLHYTTFKILNNCKKIRKILFFFYYYKLTLAPFGFPLELKNKPKTQDELTYEVAESNLIKIPSKYDMEFAALQYPVDFSESMNTVLCQELERFNGLTTVIQRSLKDVMDAIKGIIVMSQDLENVASSLFFGLVPSMWMDASYPSLKPLASYVNDFLQRLVFLESWLNGSAPPNYWISGFFFTQAFLTGTLQNFARKYKIPIDHVVYDFEIMTETHEHYTIKPEDGAYIYGLFFDGARWESEQKVLTDSKPKVLFSDAPVVWLIPCDRAKVTEYPHYTCPVYKTSERRGMLSTTGASTNYVMNIRIPADRNEDYWIEAGVAMLTQLDA